jgi:hypothetical protein
MRPLQGTVWGCALAALAVASGPAQAAWNNVFQVCCHSCRSNYAPAPPVVAAAPPCAQPCQQCTTRYVQRCYYQPVTTYRQSCYMEPVTTYRTSYYYEPVTTYRYSCYYDPCSCSYQQVAQPCTSYRLRSQCCPVTSYLQRCCLQPVTSYQQAFYYEPVTTCCTTSVGAPVAAVPGGAAVVPAQPAVPAVPAQPAVPAVPGAPGAPGAPPPSVNDQSGAPAGPPPSVSDGYGASGAPPQVNDMKYNRSPALPPTRMPRVPDSPLNRQPQLQGPVPVQPTTPAGPGRRWDRITRGAGKPAVEGQVVSRDRLPQAGAHVLFIHADQRETRQGVTTDATGRFQLTLTSGNWLVYVQDGSGRLVFDRRVEVRDNEKSAPFTLVSR